MLSPQYGALVKVERAKEHIRNLHGELSEFGSGRYKIVTERDTEKRPAYRIAEIPEIPARILLIAGDAIQNLRAALDLLIYALVTNGSNSRDLKGIEFPIKETAAKYKSEGARKIKGLGHNAVRAIDLIEPYKGGKGDTLWRLHALSIMDKHRLLIAVASNFTGIHMQSIAPDVFPEDVKTNPWLIYVGGSDCKRCPLEAGDVFYRGIPGEEVYENLQLRLDVAFNEPGILECEPMLPALNEFANLVSGIIENFSPMFL